MAAIKALLWDLDGTLIDSKQDIAECVNWTLNDMNLDSIPNEHIYEYVGHGVRTLIQGAVEEAHGHDYDSAMKLFDGYYLQHLLDNTRLYPGMEKVLAQLRDKKMAIITNKPQRYTDPIIDGLRLRDYFGVVLGREACVEMKPHPQPLQSAMERLSVSSLETMIVGDTEVDIEAGRRAGVKTCAVLFGFGKEERVRAAKPDYLIDVPEGVLNIVADKTSE